jgi:lipopolysaccharide biosynthesis glycosyltransferase
VAHGRGGHGAKLRRAHLRILKGEPEEALRILDEIAGLPECGINDERLRSLALMALERFAEAADHLRLVLEQAPNDPTFTRLLVTALQRAGAVDQLAKAEPLLTALPVPARFELLLGAKVSARDFAGIGRLYADYAEKLGGRASDSVGNVLDELAQQRQYDEADELLESLGPNPVPTARLVVAATGHYLRRGQWDEAQRWLSLVDDSVKVTDGLRLRRLQLACLTLDLERAQSLLAEWGGTTDIPRMATAPAATLFASLGEWDKVIELLEFRVSRNVPLPGEFLEVVALAARATGRYDEVFRLIARAKIGQPTSESEDLGDRLAVEVALLDALGRLNGHKPQAVPDIGKRLFDDRAALYGKLLAAEPRVTRPRRHAPAERPDGAIVLCSDLGYLLGTCVAVSSLLAHNKGITSRRRVVVVCSEDAAGLAGNAIGAIAHARGENVEIVPAEEILPPGGVEGLRTGWGWFTPGHSLSDAAYYRLFAIRHLLESGVGGRALYLDSDTCMGPGLDEFWDFDLKRRPLAARYELRIPPIEQAARKLGLDAATYFNSGVLLFNLRSKKLPELLDSAIEIAVCEPEKLTFLDQCALNIAFAGQMTPLEDRHNFYIRPPDDVDPKAKPIVRHFLTRWKPWDPTYPSKNSQPWLRELSKLGGIVAREDLQQLLAAQYRSAQVPVS